MAVQYIRILNPWFLSQLTNGLPAVGYKVYTLAAGSVSTLADTYSDKDLTAKNTNPVILGSFGEANIFVGAAAIKLVYTAPDGDLTSPIWTQDYVTEQQNTVVDNCVATSIGNNKYTGSVTPAFLAIPGRLSLVVVPDADSVDTVGLPTFTGTGINDLVFSGPNTGLNSGSQFEVEVDGTGVVDTVKWRKDGGAWTTGVAITAADQSMIDGVKFTFSVVTGHTLGDKWVVAVVSPVVFDFCGLTPTDLVVKNDNGVLVGLGAGDFKKDFPVTLLRPDTQPYWVLTNPKLPTITTQVPPRHRKVITANYTMQSGDEGTEVCANGTLTITWPLLHNIPNKFFYIKRLSGTVTVQLDAAAVTDKIWLPFATAGVTSFVMDDGQQYDSIQFQCNGVDLHVLAAATPPHGLARFMTPGVATWTCPVGVTTVYVSGSGAGGAGAGAGGAGPAGGGGGAAQYTIKQAITVVPETVYNIIIPTDSVGGANTPDPGAAGGDTVFDTLLTLTGGAGGLTGAGYTSGALYIGADGVGGMFGSGGPGSVFSGDGGDGTGYGSGGGGAATLGTGGAGKQGFLILEW